MEFVEHNQVGKNDAGPIDHVAEHPESKLLSVALDSLYSDQACWDYEDQDSVTNRVKEPAYKDFHIVAFRVDSDTIVPGNLH